jgi:hypothetical protein
MEKLTWDEIKQRYDREWVQLVDFDWADDEQYPAAGVVRVHAPTRKEFNDLTKQQPPAGGTARIYVGTPEKDPNTVICCNLHRMILPE